MFKTYINIMSTNNMFNRIAFNKYKFRIYSLLLIILIIIEWSAVDCHRHHKRRELVSAAQTKCLSNCSCKWKSGKMTVECNPNAFSVIPKGIDSGTQVLHMTGNIIQVLKARSFQSVGLTNLQRIFLNRCGLHTLDDQAFHQVSNLVELDVSNNFLTSVPTSALQYCPILRKLNFAHNSITTLLNETFIHFKHLQTIDFSDNSIQSIDANAFHGLKTLKQLYLSNNKLSYISGHCVQTLPALYELTLHNNPWNCDCKLRDLRDWMLQHNIPLSYSPNCSTPARLSGREWNSLDLDDYACVPGILSIDKQIEVYEGENASIKCVVESVPAAKVDWKVNGQAIKNMSLMAFGRQMNLIREGSNGPFQRSSTLYIMNALEKDAGSYVCVGHNRAGTVSSNLSLLVHKRAPSDSGYTGEEVAGMVLGALLISLLIFIAICFVVLRSKTHYEDISSSAPINQTVDQNRCQSDERKVLSVHMNHNSYVTQVVNSNHFEMKSMASNDSNHRSNDKTSVCTEDQNRHLNNINDKHNNGLNDISVKSDHNLHNSQPIGECVSHNSREQFSSKSDNKTQNSVSNYSKDFDILYDNNRDNSAVDNTSFPTTSSPKYQCHKNEELLRRRTSDITEELNKKFERQRLFNGAEQHQMKEGSHPTVRFSNNATVYNYQCQRFGHSMESLENNGYNDRYNDSNMRTNGHDIYGYANGEIGATSAPYRGSHIGFSYTLRPAKVSGNQRRRSGGPLAALLALDARDSPDEGLGDEREYETDILD